MKNFKGIWKTGVLAAAITLVAGMFVMRMDDWSRGLNSGFVAYGQTGGNSGTTGSSGTTVTPTTTKVVPQIVAGGGYKTVIQLINTGSSAVTVTGAFYNQDGSPSTASYSRVDPTGGVTSFTGTLPATSIPVNRIVVLKAEKATADLFVNWGSITATGPIVVAASFDFKVGDTLISRVGVSPSAADMKQFVIPRARDSVSGQEVGFAIVNTGTAAATTTVTLRGAGGEVLAAKDLTLGPKAQTAVFAKEFFGTQLIDAVGASYGFLSFSSDKAQFAVLALTVEGGNMASIPVNQLQ